VAALAAATLVMAYFVVGIQVRTVFSNLLPQTHSYVQVHERFKETFGGSNMVSIMLEVEEGDVFQLPVLERVHKITRDLQLVEGVNQFQIISLASKKLREVRASTGAIVTRPLMWPDLPETKEEIQALKEAVLNNPLVYRRYVSEDLKATLITVDFIDRLVNYETTFGQVMDIVDEGRGDDGVTIRVVGDPILYGWVNYYLPETTIIALLTVLAILAVLFILSRMWRGTLLPLLSGLVSAIWALGIARLLGFSFDPLTVVLAFLITARAVSHSVQLVTRFDDELEAGADSSRTAARLSMQGLLRPGLLGLATDAGAMMVVALTPIPLLETVALVGTMWLSTIAISAFVLTPVVLSWTRNTRGHAHPFNVMRHLRRLLDLCVLAVTSRARVYVLVAAAVLFVASGLYASNLKVGDANPGSPILWPDSTYNQDWARINEVFQGSDRMFVVIESNTFDALKKPAVLESMERFQRHMEALPEIGGSVSLADIVPTVKRTVQEGNPRYEELGNTQAENGELLYMFVSGSDPGDLDRFSDARFQNGAVTLFFRDRQGATIRTAIARINEFIENNPLEVVEYRLAGGLIGVLAAVNEVILSGQIQSIALALLIVVVLCAGTYRSTVAGMFFMVPILIANTVTFSFMAAKGIGMNINTVPVAALGIGLGVDYSIYIIDKIKEELKENDEPLAAITRALHTSGRAVFVTAATLVASMLLWTFSSLRFQAEMGGLMALWLSVSALSALFVMPALAYVFRPKFIFGGGKPERREFGSKDEASDVVAMKEILTAVEEGRVIASQGPCRKKFELGHGNTLRPREVDI
jgi:hypothetical protein